MQECFVQLRTSKSEFDGEWKWQAAGMSYVVRTCKNRLIVIDGGETQQDAEHLIETMKHLTNEKIPTVAMWIITHPHLDHYAALGILSKDRSLLSQLNIEQLCYQVSKDPILPATGASYAWDHNALQSIAKQLDVPIVEPHTDDVFYIDRLSVRFFFTPEDCLERLKDVNELSLIFQIKGQNKSVMFTGDAYERTTRLTAFRFWDDLKSDYCQLAHHGLNGGSAEFYARVAAPEVLIPISVAGERDVQTWLPGSCARQFAEKSAQKVYKAFEGDLYFPL